jgi:hypothetical protein
VTASASILPWRRLLIPFAGILRPKIILIARLFANTIRIWDDLRNILIIWQLLHIESGTDCRRKRPAIFCADS